MAQKTDITLTTAKPKVGAKPKQDKKKQVSFYVLESRINNFGGMEQCKEYLMQHLETKFINKNKIKK